ARSPANLVPAVPDGDAAVPPVTPPPGVGRIEVAMRIGLVVAHPEGHMLGPDDGHDGLGLLRQCLLHASPHRLCCPKISAGGGARTGAPLPRREGGRPGSPPVDGAPPLVVGRGYQTDVAVEPGRRWGAAGAGLVPGTGR